MVGGIMMGVVMSAPFRMVFGLMGGMVRLGHQKGGAMRGGIGHRCKHQCQEQRQRRCLPND